MLSIHHYFPWVFPSIYAHLSGWNHISTTHRRIIICVLCCHSYPSLAYCHNLHSTLQIERRGGICKKEKAITTTTHLTHKTGNESDLWLLIIGTVHFGLIREGDRQGTSIPPDMKYGGNICFLLSEDPHSLMIQPAISDRHTHTCKDTNMEYEPPHLPIHYCCQIKKKKTHITTISKLQLSEVVVSFMCGHCEYLHCWFKKVHTHFSLSVRKHAD